MVEDIITLRIENLDHHGRGISRYNNKIIFIPGALTGELVKVKVIKEKKNYLEGELIEIIEKSKSRVTPPHPYNIDNSNCDIIHIDYEMQLEFKYNKVVNIMERYSRLESIVKPIIRSDEINNYRNKTTFHVNGKIGFYKKGTHDIIEVDNCVLSDVRINSVLKIVKEKIDLKNIRSLVVRSSKYTNELMVVFDVVENIDEENIINNLKDICTSIIKKINNKYITIYGNDYIIEKMKNYSFIISPDSFFQVNTNQAIKLYDKVVEYASVTNDDIVLDLYCGTGTIGIYLSKYAKEVIGVELNKSAVLDANENKKLNNISNISFINSDVSNIKNCNLPNIDVVVVDPPRSGLDKNTVKYLSDNAFKRVVYVSCDPMTLARDLNILKEKYDVLEMTPVDMFTHTHHVETVVLMSKVQK